MEKMENLRLEIKDIGFCGNELIRHQLEEFVLENFDMLYFGAIRRKENIRADDYAPRRVQTNTTRLHQYRGLKIAGRHHIDAEEEITDEQLKLAVADIQLLLDAAALEEPSSFQLVIINKKDES